LEFIANINNADNFELDVRLAKKGDKEAFARLIENNKTSLYRVALSMLSEKQDIEDAIQNCIIKAYEGVIYLRRNEFFKTWIIRILINECKYIMKNNNRVIHIEEVNTDIAVNDNYNNLELTNAVSLLEEDLKIVTTLFYFEDIPQKDIAKILGIPEGTVRSRLSRARNKLYDILKER
jgi:RNA polymerase sigma-70 factor, ECF subfamily